MSENGKVWLLAGPQRELDHALYEALAEKLGPEVTLELKERARGHDVSEGFAERLRMLVSDRSETSSSDFDRDLIASHPDVVVASNAEELKALFEIARRGGPRPVRIGIVREPELGPAWLQAPADLLAVIDDHAATTAKSRAGTVRVTGAYAGPAFVPVVNAPAEREQQGLAPDAHILFIPAGTVPPEDRTQLLIQLGLVRVTLEVIFEVEDAAEADDLRAMVPAHGIAASLVSSDDRGAPLWALAHLIYTRAGLRNLCRARAVGVPVLIAPPRGETARKRAHAVAASGAGRSASSPATLAVDIDLSLEPERYEEMVARQRALRVDDPVDRLVKVIIEGLTRGPELATKAAGLPQGLERICQGPADRGRPPDRVEEAVKAATEVRDQGEFWSQRARVARSRGEEDLAIEADKRASHHRLVLNRLLDELRQDTPEEAAEEGEDLEDELDSLRKKVMTTHNVEDRLRALDVEDELRELKERLEHE
jgi:hypothetical protein